MSWIEIGRDELHALIKDYLLTEGYEATLKSFESVTNVMEDAGHVESSMEVEEEEKKDEGGGGAAVSSKKSSSLSSNTATGESTAEERNGQEGGLQHAGEGGEEEERLDALVACRRGVMMDTLSDRMKLREEILHGEVSVALDRLRKKFPEVLKARPFLRFELQVRNIGSFCLVVKLCGCLSSCF